MCIPSVHIEYVLIIIITEFLTPPHGVVVSEVESTSVEVTWQAVHNADRYTVTLSQTMGDDQLGLCPEDSHTVSVNTSSLSVVVGDDMLRAYTTYSTSVVAESDVWCSSQNSDSFTFSTTQTSMYYYNINIKHSLLSLKVHQCLLAMSQQQLLILPLSLSSGMA